MDKGSEKAVEMVRAMMVMKRMKTESETRLRRWATEAEAATVRVRVREELALPLRAFLPVSVTRRQACVATITVLVSTSNITQHHFISSVLICVLVLGGSYYLRTFQNGKLSLFR